MHNNNVSTIQTSKKKQKSNKLCTPCLTLFLYISEVDEFRFCCLARDVQQCLPEPDEFSSCEDLMSNYLLRITIWILGTVAFFGNLLVFIWRVRDDRNGKVRVKYWWRSGIMIGIHINWTGNVVAKSIVFGCWGGGDWNGEEVVKRGNYWIETQTNRCKML